jgi:hypothetical protein
MVYGSLKKVAFYNGTVVMYISYCAFDSHGDSSIMRSSGAG